MSADGRGARLDQGSAGGRMPTGSRGDHCWLLSLAAMGGTRPDGGQGEGGEGAGAEAQTLE